MNLNKNIIFDNVESSLTAKSTSLSRFDLKTVKVDGHVIPDNNNLLSLLLY